MIEQLPKSTLNWYAINTRPRFEKKVQQHLVQQNYISYLPLVTTIKQWSDRKKKVLTPLIPSYIFIKADEVDLKETLQIPGVVSFLKYLGKTAKVKNQEIENLKILLQDTKNISFIKNAHLEKGKMVMVENGVFKGLVAECVQFNGKHRVIVRINGLENNIEVNIPLSFVSKI